MRRDPTDRRFRTVTVGFPGMLGSLDIINEHGIALSFNQLGHSTSTCSEPVFLMMRRIAEHCSTFESARQEILHASEGMPFIITLSSAKEKMGSIFQRDASGEQIERSIGAEYARISASNTPQDDVIIKTPIDEAVQEARISTTADVCKLLGDERIAAGNNIYSLVFDFENNTLHLASGSLPAAHGTYRPYPLF